MQAKVKFVKAVLVLSSSKLLSDLAFIILLSIGVNLYIYRT